MKKKKPRLTYSEIKERLLILQELDYVRKKGKKAFVKTFSGYANKKTIQIQLIDIVNYTGDLRTYIDFLEQKKKLEFKNEGPHSKGDVYHEQIEVLKLHKGIPSRIKIGTHEYILNVKG